jgi:hypothetical protein
MFPAYTRAERMTYYSQRPERPPRWYHELFAIVAAVLGILLWPLIILGGFAVWLIVTVVAFTAHWALGVLLLLVLAGAIAVFAYWDSHRPPQIQS